MEKDADEETGNWRVVRQDDAGNRFLVRGGLSQKFAEALAKKFNDRGHKQFFWAEESRPAKDGKDPAF